MIDGEWSRVCPRRPILDNPLYYAKLFEYYHHYKNGKYPDEGGYSSQPYKLMTLFKEMERIINECEDMKSEGKAKNKK